jgi:1-acyl-sn-glycerol-3-phosphate acyltransferase
VAAGLSYIVFAAGASLPGMYILILGLVPMNADTKQLRVRKVISSLCRFYVNFMQALGLFSFNFVSAREIKPQGHLVIANHSMLIDALFILANVDNLCCVVKSELLSNPFMRVPMKLAGYISNQDDKLVEWAKSKLELGENILIFPEGTRGKDDLQLDFKRGAANIAVASNAPILPIVIACRPRVLRKGDKWYQLPRLKPRILIDIKPVIEVKDCLDARLPQTLQYRRLTAWLKDYYRSNIIELVSQIDSH